MNNVDKDLFEVLGIIFLSSSFSCNHLDLPRLQICQTSWQTKPPQMSRDLNIGETKVWLQILGQILLSEIQSWIMTFLWQVYSCKPLDVSKNSDTTKWMVKISGKTPMSKWMIWGGKIPPLCLVQHPSRPLLGKMRKSKKPNQSNHRLPSPSDPVSSTVGCVLCWHEQGILSSNVMLKDRGEKLPETNIRLMVQKSGDHQLIWVNISFLMGFYTIQVVSWISSISSSIWKLMVGRWSFPFGVRHLFRCHIRVRKGMFFPSWLIVQYQHTKELCISIFVILWKLPFLKPT